MNKDITTTEDQSLVGVHDGVFHSDEVIAVALLNLVGETKVIRTRCPLTLGECEVLVDVGGEYDPMHQKYDHHQFTMKSLDYGLSSAGLVWKDVRSYCKTAYASITDMDALIAAVDARDTRVGYDPSNVYEPIFEAISACNTLNPMGDEQDHRFNIMVSEVENIIVALMDKNLDMYTRRITSLERLADSYTIEKKFTFNKRQIFRQEVGKVIVSEFFPEWRKISRELSKCFVMPGDKEGQYKIMTDTSKYHIVVTKDEVFTHANGFISIVQPKEKSKELGIALSNGELFEVSIEEIEEAFLHIHTLLGEDL